MKRLLQALFLLSFWTIVAQLEPSNIPELINMEEYQEYAEKEFELNYEQTVQIVAQHAYDNQLADNDSLLKESFVRDPLSIRYPREKLKIYSVPIFELKQHPFETECNGRLIDLVDWDTTDLRQRVLITVNDTLVSEFGTSVKTMMLGVPRAGLVFNTFIKDDKPVFLGGSFKNFFPYDRVEKDHLTFEITGFMGRFAIKDNELFYVRNEWKGKYGGIKYSKVQDKGAPVWHKVDAEFIDKIKKERAMSSSFRGNLDRMLKRCLNR